LQSPSDTRDLISFPTRRSSDLGGVLGKNKYNVRMVKQWAGNNHLERTNVTYGEALIFSSHLVHGLAVNEELDITRVSLEFTASRSEEHTSELQSRENLVCRLLL